MLVKPLFLPLAVAGLVLLSGCMAYGSDVVYRRPLPERGPVFSARQIDRDAGEYVRHLDRHLRLDRRQRRHIHRMLADRTDHLLRTTRPAARIDVYPFPREYDRYPNRTVRRWWMNADRNIERVLDRRQRETFRWLQRDDARSYKRKGPPSKRQGPRPGRGRGY